MEIILLKGIIPYICDMELENFGSIKKATCRKPLEFHQTGFSSPATHYAEPTIDLNRELVGNRSATFFIRASSGKFSGFGIEKNDVLIIDRSLVPKPDNLALVIEDGEFEIRRIEKGEKKLELWGVITYIIHLV